MPNDHRIVLVTGGAYGIGRAAVRRFAEEGATVLFADIDTERGESLSSQVEGAHFLNIDVRLEDDIARLVETAVSRFGRIDVICSNAGVERYARADEYSVADWSFIVDTNLRAGFLLVKHAYGHLRASGGNVVFVSSVQAIANEPGISVYAASKAGILGLVRGMAVDFASDGVRVNAVCPGAVLTGMMENAPGSGPEADSARAQLGASIPLRRIGAPEEIAEAIYFLASSRAAYITGAALVVDGGLLARLSL